MVATEYLIVKRKDICNLLLRDTYYLQLFGNQNYSYEIKSYLLNKALFYKKIGRRERKFLPPNAIRFIYFYYICNDLGIS